MSKLIEKDGERQFVTDGIDSYIADGWVVIAEGEAAEPKDDHDFDEKTKKWKPNPEKKAQRDFEAWRRRKSKLELVQMIEMLTLRMEIVEQELEELKNA